MNEQTQPSTPTLGQALGARFRDMRTDQVRQHLVDAVYAGSWVEARTMSGAQYRFRLVGSHVGVHKRYEDKYLVHGIRINSNREVEFYRPDGSASGHSTPVVEVLHKLNGQYRTVWARHPKQELSADEEDSYL